jgi:hypothetical protein
MPLETPLILMDSRSQWTIWDKYQTGSAGDLRKRLGDRLRDSSGNALR